MAGNKITAAITWLNGKLIKLTSTKISLAADKQMHILVGVVICLAVGLLLGYSYGLIAAGIAGAVKEIWDKLSGKGTPECKDMLATWGGGMIGCVILLIKEAVVR